MAYVLISILALVVAVLSYIVIKTLDSLSILESQVIALQDASINEITEVKMPEEKTSKKKTTKKDAA